jgi:hypothetical protein
MTLPKETIHTGAPNKCPDCGKRLVEEVLYSPAGYYIGTQCCCGPYSRESYYYISRETAQKDLDARTVKYREL